MSRRRRLLLWTVLLVILAAAGFVAVAHLMEPDELRALRQVKFGMTRDEVHNLFGRAPDMAIREGIDSDYWVVGTLRDRRPVVAIVYFGDGGVLECKIGGANLLDRVRRRLGF